LIVRLKTRSPGSPLADEVHKLVLPQIVALNPCFQSDGIPIGKIELARIARIVKFQIGPIAIQLDSGIARLKIRILWGTWPRYVSMNPSAGSQGQCFLGMKVPPNNKGGLGHQTTVEDVQ